MIDGAPSENQQKSSLYRVATRETDRRLSQAKKSPTQTKGCFQNSTLADWVTKYDLEPKKVFLFPGAKNLAAQIKAASNNFSFRKTTVIGP